ncbi:MAG TPA: phenylacetic acid degradation protein PaaD [Gammaproteobacteria bacterium]|nr:phenylacetic acid degradation protein PaaD [Gammaproteobacteria bacterium]
MDSVEQSRLAEHVADVLGKMDSVSKQLGIERLSVGPGCARMRLVIDDSMVNGHGLCHTGILCTLADICTAYAACSYNENTLAQSLSIQLIAPVPLGTKLYGNATEVCMSGRTGIYDVEITNEAGAVVSVVRCQCRQTKGTVSENFPRGRN